MTKTLEEMIAVMQAAAEGKLIECRYTDDREPYPHWTLVEPTWNWNLCDYRVAEIPDSIDWSQLDKRWRYMARNRNGKTSLFTNIPIWSSVSGSWYVDIDSVDAYVHPSRRVDDLIASYRRGTVPAERSLVERPE